MRRFVRCQQDLYAYILTLVPNVADAQDILQETAIAIWGKADEYRLEEPFMPWACRFAWFQVRKFRMYQARRGRHVIALSDEALSALAAQRTAVEASLAGRERRLQECVDKLDEADRSLLERRYAEKGSIRQLARQSGVDAAQLYKRLGRNRQMLLDCIYQTTGDEGTERR